MSESRPEKSACESQPVPGAQTVLYPRDRITQPAQHHRLAYGPLQENHVPGAQSEMP